MLRSFKSALLISLLVLGPIGLAACGGGSEDTAAPVTTTETVPELTQADLVSAGDGICAEINAAVGTIQASETSDETVQAAQIADLYAGLAERLDSLGSPSDGEPPTDVIAAADDLGDPENIDREASLAEFQQAAADYGFTDCADSPEAPVSNVDGSGIDSGSGTGSDTATDGGVEPTPVPEPEPAPVDPSTGGGVVPVPPDSGGGSGGSGGSSGGIGPG